MFALVIGIDKYEYKSQGFHDLTGCKNDGERLINFLTDVLGVPLSQIVFLADEEATRQEIVKQFNQFLIKNEDIQRNDAIIFFFAGYGSQLAAPQRWLTDNNKIETLCSHDYRTIGDDGKEVLGICDRAIDALMRKLAFEKGDNIICLSCSLNLVIPPGTLRSGCAYCNTDKLPIMASHILLTACRPGEAAFEDPDAKDASGGQFTTALIEGLRRSSFHDTGYTKLFETLDLKHSNIQHPQCEGTNRDRLLFSVNTLRNGRTTARVPERGNKLWVSAGSIHGIVDDAEFAVITSTQELILKAQKVRAFETMLEGRNHNITDAEAFVLNGDHPTLRVHTSSHHSSARLTVVPANEPADIALHQNDFGNWVLERLDPLILGYADHSIQVDANASQIEYILGAIANFNFYLYRSDGAAASLSGKVKIQLNRIGEIQG
ncbi:caspase domain-containing protein [Boletus coccyginus]|nr:caspase domain-containing protein [Boletus coccyginus]